MLDTLACGIVNSWVPQTVRNLKDSAGSIRPYNLNVPATCSFSNGGIAHVGGMGLALLDGTAGITIEGNDIHDLGGGGIAMGAWKSKNLTVIASLALPWDRLLAKATTKVTVSSTTTFIIVAPTISRQLESNANLTQESVIAHNLVHDTTYCGLVIVGNIPQRSARARDNVVEYNHIYNVMKTCTDGAGIYIIQPQAGMGTTVRGNLIHDVQYNPFNTRPEKVCFGMYLDLISKKLSSRKQRRLQHLLWSAPLLWGQEEKTTHGSTTFFKPMEHRPRNSSRRCRLARGWSRRIGVRCSRPTLPYTITTR